MSAEMQAQAEALLKGTTEGRWLAYRKWNGDHDIHARKPTPDDDDTDTVLMIRCAASPEDAALMAAAPKLARQVVELAGEVARLREAAEALNPHAPEFGLNHNDEMGDYNCTYCTAYTNFGEPPEVAMHREDCPVTLLRAALGGPS